tara:strand:+ start:97 stop:480 length:384 start_codon:yes stop_codon:yes gene_type:complete
MAKATNLQTTLRVQAATPYSVTLPSGGWSAVVTMLAKSANYTVTLSDGGSDCQIAVDASGAGRTITLYAASGNSGHQIKVKKIDSSVNTVTIDANASETIDGATTQVISAQWTSLSLVCDGSNWLIF